MSGCIDCGRPTQNARCQTCRVEHLATTEHEPGPCPDCGTETVPAGTRCGECIGGGA